MRARSIILAALAALASAAVPALSVGSGPAPRPDPVVKEWPGWPYRANCGQMSFDPIEVFSGPAAAERGGLPSERALRRMLARDFPFPLPDHGWRLAAQRRGKALFLHGHPGAEMDTAGQLDSFELWRRRGHWEMNSFSGPCRPFSVRRGRYATTWFLAKGQPALDADTTRIRITVGAIPCIRGEDVNSRAEPVFDEIAGKLVLTVFMRPWRHQASLYCEEDLPLDPPLVLDLPGALGVRGLYSGALFPPAPAERLRETHVEFGRQAVSRSARLRQ